MQSDRHQGGRNAPTMSSPHPKLRQKLPRGGTIPTTQFVNEFNSWPQENASLDDRERGLADIATHGDEDNAEVAAADLAREFPRSRQTTNQVAVRI
jgi:hypothetical protein